MVHGGGGTDLSASLTDLMTSLAVIFVLLLVASLHNVKQESAAARVEIRDELRAELNDPSRGLNIDVKDDPQDPLGLLVIIPDDLLRFKKSRSDVPPTGVAFLGRFIPVVAETVCKPKFVNSINSIVVEGHTDSDASEAFNLALSQRRSMEVLAESLKILEVRDASASDATLLRRCLLRFTSASGRGEEELLPEGAVAGTEDQALSRRVVFKIRVKSAEQRSLTDTLGQVR